MPSSRLTPHSHHVTPHLSLPSTSPPPLQRHVIPSWHTLPIAAGPISDSIEEIFSAILRNPTGPLEWKHLRRRRRLAARSRSYLSCKSCTPPSDTVPFLPLLRPHPPAHGLCFLLGWPVASRSRIMNVCRGPYSSCRVFY